MMLSLLCRFDPNYTNNHLLPARQIGPTDEEQKSKVEQFARRPVVSIVMTTFNSDLAYLKRAIGSIYRQTYPYWELCIADDASTDVRVCAYLTELSQADPRCKVHFRTSNGHMSRASNDALALAEGEFVALVDHDDELAASALFWVVDALHQYPNAKMFYTDEDKIDAFGYRFLPSLKPRWSPELCLSQNYVCHLGVYDRRRLQSIGGFRAGFEGSQDHDMLLRFVEGLDESEIIHISRVLYHWRTLPTSTAGNGASNKPYALVNGQRAVQEAVLREGKMTARTDNPHWGYQTRWSRDGNSNKPVHVVIHSATTLIEALQAAEDLCLPPPSAIWRWHLASKERPSVAEQTPFVMTPTIGSAASLAAYVNDIVRKDPDAILICIQAGLRPSHDIWIDQLCGQVERAGVGLASAKIVGDDELLVTAGWNVNARGMAFPEGALVPVRSLRQFGRLHVSFNVDAIDRRLMAVQASDLALVGGLPEIEDSALADVTCALRLRALGRRHVVEGWLSFWGKAKVDRPVDLLSWEPAERVWSRLANGQLYHPENYLTQLPKPPEQEHLSYSLARLT